MLEAVFKSMGWILGTAAKFVGCKETSSASEGVPKVENSSENPFAPEDLEKESEIEKILQEKENS